MERGDDDASWPIPPEVPVQVQGLGVAMGKNRPVISFQEVSGGFRRSGLSGLLQSVSNDFKLINFFIFRKQGQGKGFTGLPSAGTFSGGTSGDVPWMGARTDRGVTML